MSSSLALRLQKETADFLTNKLENKEITESRASEIADFIIQSLPDNITDEGVIKILPHLDDTYPELEEIVDLYLMEMEDNRKSEVADKATTLINQGKLNAANQTITDFFNKDNG